MKKSIRLRARAFVPALSVLYLASCAAFADDVSDKTNEVLVTASRRVTSVDQTFQSVSLITRDQIEQSGALSVADLLIGLPGISTARSGGVGKATSIYMRGTTTNQLLVLVDGVRVSSAGTGEFDWNSVLPEQIEKIEIVRGPLASLYGSDAMGGVVQIFMREPAKGIQISHTTGSYGTRQTDLSLGGGNDWHYGLNVGERSVNGMQTVINRANRYGSKQNYIDGKLIGKLAQNTRIKAGWHYSDGDNTDEYGTNHFRSYGGNFRLENSTTDSWSQAIQLGHYGVNLIIPKGFPPGELSTERNSVSIQNLVATSVGLVSLGAESWVDKVIKIDYSGSSSDVRNDLSTTAVFGQFETNWKNVDFQVGGRRDHHNVYGDQSTYNVAAGKRLTPKLQLIASHGTAFKAPSANDLFWPHVVEPNYDSNPPYSQLSSAGGTCGPNVPSSWSASTPCVFDTLGNTALKPEKSKTNEIGFRYVDSYIASVNYFETQINDLIVWKSQTQGTGDSYGAYYQPQNVSQANIKGIELTAAQRIGELRVFGNLTRLLATNQDSGLQLDRRPKNSGSITLSTDFGAHRFSTTAQLVSERLDSSGAYILPGYGVLNVSDLYTIDKSWSVQGRIENLLNKEYSLATSFGTPYATPGRSAYLTLRYRYP